MSELQESIVRSQAILMINRNPGKTYIWKRVYNRFMRCINISKKINKRIKNNHPGAPVYMYEWAEDGVMRERLYTPKADQLDEFLPGVLAEYK